MSNIVDKKLQSIAVGILNSIAEGKDEQSVCEEFGIRRGTLIQWTIKYPEFDAAIKVARVHRADSFKSEIHKRAIDQISNPLEKDDVPGEKLLFEQLKWLASVDNPDKFGTKIKHDGNIVSPVQIVVDTGIKKMESDELASLPAIDVEETNEVDFL